MLATTTSCSVAYGTGRLADRAAARNPALAGALRSSVPFIACAAANLLNLAAMRSGDLRAGVPVRDAEGHTHGNSPAAARHAFMQAGATRVVLPAPALLLPPILMRALDAVVGAAKWRGRPLVELGVIVSCVWGALPCAIALFPQVISRREPPRRAECSRGERTVGLEIGKPRIFACSDLKGFCAQPS